MSRVNFDKQYHDEEPHYNHDTPKFVLQLLDDWFYLECKQEKLHATTSLKNL